MGRVHAICSVALIALWLPSLPHVESRDHRIHKPKCAMGTLSTCLDTSPVLGKGLQRSRFGIAEMAAQRCRRFVVFTREGIGGTHLMKVLDSLPEVSVAFDPFGRGQEA
eukprot:1634268-Pyramimonas_sp.AAC.1